MLLCLAGSCGGGGAHDDPGSVDREAEKLPAGGWRLPISARYELRTEGKPEGVAIADLDGDGAPELCALTREPGALVVWTSALGVPRTIPLDDFPLGPLVVEWNGRTLVAVAPRTGRELLLLDLRDPSPLASALRFQLSDVPRVMGKGDLAGDGTSDLGVTTRDGRLHVIDPARRLEVALVDAQSTLVAIATEGVLVGSQSGECLRAYALEGAGELVPAVEPIPLGGIPRAHARADFDGDGASEHLVAGGDDALWRIDDPFGAREVMRLPADAGAIPLDIEMLAGSSPPALVSLSFRELAYRVWRASGVVHREYAGQDAWDVASGDLDRDGRPDLAFALRDAHRVAVLLGQDHASFEEAERLPVESGPHSLAAADLDGDGAREILVLCALSVPEALCVLQRQGERWSRFATLEARRSADCLRVGDLDGDGAPDLAFLERGEAGARLVVVFGKPGEVLGADSTTAELVLGGGSGDLLLADLDGDGRDEAIAADPERGRVVLARTDAARALALVAAQALPSAPHALAVVERDGRPSIAVALGEPGPRIGLALLEVSGNGAGLALAERAFLPVVGVLPIDVAILRGPEGLAWLALLSKAPSDGAPGRVDLFAVGTDTSIHAIETFSTGLRPFALAAGDLDGDGRDDLIASAQNSHHLNAWLATPSSLRPLPDLGAGLGVLDLLCTDLDGDGKLELVSANAFSNDLSILHRR